MSDVEPNNYENSFDRIIENSSKFATPQHENESNESNDEIGNINRSNNVSSVFSPSKK
jgi:hypothetical protein